MTVHELFESEKIPLEFVEDFAESKGSEYWDSCVKFLNDKWQAVVEDLTERQSSWLDRILEDCIEARIERGGR